MTPRHDWKLTRLVVVAVLLAGCVAKVGAQSVRVPPADTLLLSAKLRVDTLLVTRVVHDTVTVTVTKIRVDTIYLPQPTPQPVPSPTPTPVPVPVDTTGVPKPGPTSTILWRDDFEWAPIGPFTDALAGSHGYSLEPDHVGVTVDAGANSGRGMLFSYSAAHSANMIEHYHTPVSEACYQFKFKVDPADANPAATHEAGMKFFEIWREGSAPRLTWGVGNLRPSANTGLEFSTHDNSSGAMPDPWTQNVSKALTFKNTRGTGWHTYTACTRVGPAGYDKLWIDATLVLDNTAQRFDRSAVKVNRLRGPDLVVKWSSANKPFTIRWDDLLAWKP